MKICATSDLHGILPKIESCELVLICGDIVPLRMQRNIPQSEKWLKTTFADWVKSLPCDLVIMVGGNHDFAIANMYQDFHKQYHILKLPTNGKLVLLENTKCTYMDSVGKTYTIWGTPFCKPFGNWAFMYEPETLIKAYETMPEYCDIVLSHDAPELCGLGKIHQGSQEGVNAGNSWLADEMFRKHPKYTFCGHIHSGEHELQSFDDMKMANVSLVDETYSETFKPLYLDV